MAPRLRLVSDCAAPAEAQHPDLADWARKTFRVVTQEFADQQVARGLADARARFTTEGHLVPATGRWERICLNRHRATKAWRVLAVELDTATDAVAEALQPAPEGVIRLDPDSILAEAVIAWRTVAVRVLSYPAPKVDQLRSLVALAAILAGARFVHGRLNKPKNAAEWAFAALDWSIYVAQHDKRERGL